MGVYKELQLQKKYGRPVKRSPEGEAQDPVKAMATKLAWAVGSTLKETYPPGSALKIWATSLAQRIWDRKKELRP